MNIFKMEFRRNLKSLLIWSAVSAAITVLLTLLYPSMINSDMLALMNAKIAALPKELVESFNLSGEDIRYFPSFFAYFFQFVLMAACIYGAQTGLTALTKEESEGTIEFLYAKPTSRPQIVTAKLSAAFAGYLCYFAVIGLFSVIAGMAVRPENLDLNEMITAVKSVVLGGMLAGFTYLFLGFLVSVLLRRAKHAASLAVMLFFGTYIIGSIPKFTGVLDFLKWVSPMNYFQPNNIVASGIDGLNVLIAVLIMAVSAAVTYILYRKRDFYV